MKITTFGAAGEVTGSCYLVETGQARVLVDFGMHQGGRAEWQRNLTMPPIEPTRLDAVVVTHAHIDHVGRLPMLWRSGYRGPIYATQATCELTALMLRDSAHIQEADARRANERRQRIGMAPIEPLYTINDVEPLLNLLKPVSYDQPKEVARGTVCRWVEAGHILGSASIEMRVAAMGPRPARTVVFSGDLGPSGMPLLRDPTHLHNADLVFLESTYGDRDHRSREATVAEFETIVKAVVWDRQRLLIPAFAVGRSQTLVYHLAALVRAGRSPRFPVFVDSPMASEAFDLYRRSSSLFDEEARAIMSAGDSPLDMTGLSLVRTSEESKRLNSLDGACVIIAASGMCTGGRILHHLRHGLWRRGVHIMIAGYQAAGSLGRQLVDGASMVKIMGDQIAVRAKVHTLGGFSAHAGQTELLAWAASFKGGSPDGGWPRFALTHGEDMPRTALSDKLIELGVQTTLPQMGSTIEV